MAESDFSKMPVSSMLARGLTIPRPTRRKQAWIVRLRLPSVSRNLTSLLSPGRPSDSCLRNDKTWPSKSSPGRKRSQSFLRLINDQQANEFWSAHAK